MLYFGIKLKQLRSAKRLTQKELADRLELTKATISAYESSSKYPSIEVLIKICTYFDVSSDYLLGLSDNRTFQVEPLTDEQIALVNGIINQFNHLNNC